MNQIGYRLRELREQKGLKQADLAKILKKSQRMISKYEKQESELDYKTLLKYAEYFHVTTDYLLGRVTKPNEYNLSVENYPDILKPLVSYGYKSNIIFSGIKYIGNETEEEKKQAIEEVLKKIDVYEYEKELEQNKEYALRDQLEYMLSYLPENKKGKHISFNELLYIIENETDFTKNQKANGFYNKGEFVFNLENKQKEKPTTISSDKLKSDSPIVNQIIEKLNGLSPELLKVALAQLDSLTKLQDKPNT